MAKIHLMASSPFLVKSSGKPTLILTSRVVDISTSMVDSSGEGLGFGLWRGTGGEEISLLECSEVISISKLEGTEVMGSGMETIVSGRGSSVAVNSCHVSMSRFLQVLDILLLPVTPDGLLTPNG